MTDTPVSSSGVPEREEAGRRRGKRRTPAAKLTRYVASVVRDPHREERVTQRAAEMRAATTALVVGAVRRHRHRAISDEAFAEKIMEAFAGKKPRG